MPSGNPCLQHSIGQGPAPYSSATFPAWTPTAGYSGVIRPTVEILGKVSHSGHIGIVGTPGTVASQSYNMEIEKLYPEFKTFTHACPMWVPLVEYREANSPGADYFVKRC